MDITDNDGSSMQFRLPCPGVLELPDRTIQFFNLWDDSTAVGSRIVMVAVSDDEVIEMRAGDTARVGDVDVVIDSLDDPALAHPISGSVRPAPG